MTVLKVCGVCLKEQPVNSFVKGRNVCKGCYSARVAAKYSARTGFAEQGPRTFKCEVCGQTFCGDYESSVRAGLCRGCYRETLLERKRKAPAILKCRVCGEKKPKEEFEKYSTSRCKECARKQVNAHYHKTKGFFK